MARFYLEPLLSSLPKILLPDEKKYLCGSDESSDIDIRINHPSVSPKHCIFQVTSHGLQVFDLKSANGTFINRLRIPPNSPNYYAFPNDIIGISHDGVNILCTKTPHVYRLRLTDYGKKSFQSEIKFTADSNTMSTKFPNNKSHLVIDLTGDDDSNNYDNDDDKFAHSLLENLGDQNKVKDGSKKLTPDNIKTKVKMVLKKRSVTITETEKIISTVKPSNNSLLDNSEESIKKILNESIEYTQSHSSSTSSVEELDSLNGFEVINAIKDKKRRLKASLLKHEIQSSIKALPKTSKNKNINKLKRKYKERLEEAQFDLHAEPLKTNSCSIEPEVFFDVTSSSCAQVEPNQPSSSNSGSKISDSDTQNKTNTSLNNFSPKKLTERSKEKRLTEPEVFLNSTDKDIIEIPVEQVNEPLRPTPLYTSPLPTVQSVHTFNNTTRNVIEMPLEFLSSILNWSPGWLDDIIYNRESQNSRPFIGEDFDPHLSAYISYADYHKIMSSLILLETWACIVTNYHSGNQLDSWAAITQHSIRSINGTNLIEFTADILCNTDQITNKFHPQYGELVILKLLIMNQGNYYTQPIFAYINNVQKTVLTSSSLYNYCLCNTVDNPCTLITFTLVTQQLPSFVDFTQVHSIKSVFNLRSQLCLMKAVEYLPSTPFSEHIFQPDSRQNVFVIQKVPDYSTYNFATGDNLNHKQAMAIVSITNTLMARRPKICLIQGPPAAGKSRVLVNTVIEMMYGQDRYQNNDRQRILICAPTNEAVDKIALRLLNVKAKFKLENSRELFKIVRVGIHENMNPDVYQIAVNDLNFEFENDNNYTRPMNENIDAEKNKLLDKIGKIVEQMHGQVQLSDQEYDSLHNKCKEYIFQLQLLDYNHRHRHDESSAQIIDILVESDVILTKLSSCDSYIMKEAFGEKSLYKISVCIIDDASMCQEPESLLPLMFGVKQLILFGDPKEYPSEIQSSLVKEHKYHTSLFSRMIERFKFNANNPVISLPKQWPFYSYKVFNLNNRVENIPCSSKEEANFVVNLIHMIISHVYENKIDEKMRINVITLFDEQQQLISNILSVTFKTLPDALKNQITIDIDTFGNVQDTGTEIVILSCLRSDAMGYAYTSQLLSQTLARAKFSLFICGNFQCQNNVLWMNLLSDAISRQLFHMIDHQSCLRDIGNFIIRPFI